jgi:hypothetical protein
MMYSMIPQSDEISSIVWMWWQVFGLKHERNPRATGRWVKVGTSKRQKTTMNAIRRGKQSCFVEPLSTYTAAVEGSWGFCRYDH